MKIKTKICIIIFLILISKLYPSELKIDTIKIDIKTKFSEKIDLLNAKVGFSHYIKQIPWISITEFDENYSVWIKDYESRLKSDKIITTARLEIRTPTTFKTGKLLKEEKIKVVYKEKEQLSIGQDCELAPCEECNQESNFLGYHLTQEFLDIISDIEPKVKKNDEYELWLYQESHIKNLIPDF